MGSGRLVIRLTIVVLLIVLAWKVWDYTSLPGVEDFKVKDVRNQQDKDCCDEDKPVLQPPAVTQRQELEVPAFPPMQVVVYYEALCPDSRYFVVKQLLPTYNKLKDFITVALVPYGKAKTTEIDGHYTFTCQHGHKECQANMVHACVTNKVKDEAKQLSIVSCMIENNINPMKAGQRCVEKFGEEWSGVEECVTGEKGASILKHMGDMTDNLRPRVSFIPTITVDGSQSGQSKMLQDFHKALCRRFKDPKPPSC